MVPVAELRRKGLIDSAGNVIKFEPPGFNKFQPHPNFGKRRPDLLIYGGGSLV